jgi:hypothetical protein
MKNNAKPSLVSTAEAAMRLLFLARKSVKFCHSPRNLIKPLGDVDFPSNESSQIYILSS